VKTCEDVAPNIGENRPGCFNHDNTPSHISVLTQQFLAKYEMAVIPTHRTPLIWHPLTSSVSKNEIEAERTPV
jgi:hypothetical protein